MILNLNIHSLRNISQAKLTLNPDINIFYGNNGSGKTSLLESLYLLSTGYSFKTRETQPIVSYGKENLTLFAKTFNNETISLNKIINGITTVKINSEICKNNSILAKFIPCLVFNQDIFNIINTGPSVRRNLIDWGMFHVKHNYHILLSDYKQIIKQRNALLRQKPKEKDIIPWNIQLVKLAMEIDVLRQNYFIEWITKFDFFLKQLSNIECKIRYYKGWRNDKDLMNILIEQFYSDVNRQYTQSGAHQADFYIELDAFTAKQGLSRGQQKIITIALKLAQASLLEKQCIYLFDDLTSELDVIHIEKLLNCLNSITGQKIITVLEPHIVKKYLNNKVNYFSIDNGNIISV